MRNAGKTYLEIAEKGGGIWSSVQHTRNASEKELLETLLERINRLISLGITTIEIKSGYGLNVESELKMLRVIQQAQTKTKATLVPTCLSAHLKPRDFEGNNEKYLQYIVDEILPKVKEENLAKRVDIFIEKSAFQPEESRKFLEKAKEIMLERTHIPEAPWWVVQAVDKKRARLNCIDHLLSQFNYHEVEHAEIALPARVRNPDYIRHPVPQNMIVPEKY